jgi:hypothetical protein
MDTCCKHDGKEEAKDDEKKGCCGECPKEGCDGCDCSKPENKADGCMGGACACEKGR